MGAAPDDLILAAAQRMSRKMRIKSGSVIRTQLSHPRPITRCLFRRRQIWPHRCLPDERHADGLEQPAMGSPLVLAPPLAVGVANAFAEFWRSPQMQHPLVPPDMPAELAAPFGSRLPDCINDGDRR